MSNSHEEAQKMVDRHAEQLGEHFDAVIVIASRGNPDTPQYTQIVTRGRGNWFAQRGMMEELLQNDQARRIAENLKPQGIE